jgi:hypothetical protein
MLRDDEEKWLNSFMKTTAAWDESSTSKLWFIFGMICSPTGRKLPTLMSAIQKKKLKNFNKEDSHFKEVLKSVYREHNERVRAVIPRDKLLVINVKQGWKPLCEFLGVEVPDVPFPRANVNSEDIRHFINSSNFGKKVFKEVVLMLTFLVVFAAAIFAIFA